MSDVLEVQLAALGSINRVQLRAEWRRVYRASPPSFTADLLARGIADVLQTKAYGGLDRKIEVELAKLAARERDESAAPSVPTIKPGTRLLRTWNGKTHVVLVTDDGYVYQDRTYRSLSAIAEEITGAHWSGPRFFGLKTRTKVRGDA